MKLVDAIAKFENGNTGSWCYLPTKKYFCYDKSSGWDVVELTIFGRAIRDYIPGLSKLYSNTYLSHVLGRMEIEKKTEYLATNFINTMRGLWLKTYPSCPLKPRVTMPKEDIKKTPSVLQEKSTQKLTEETIEKYVSSVPEQPKKSEESKPIVTPFLQQKSEFVPIQQKPPQTLTEKTIEKNVSSVSEQPQKTEATKSIVTPKEDEQKKRQIPEQTEQEPEKKKVSIDSWKVLQETLYSLSKGSNKDMDERIIPERGTFPKAMLEKLLKTKDKPDWNILDCKKKIQFSDGVVDVDALYIEALCSESPIFKKTWQESEQKEITNLSAHFSTQNWNQLIQLLYGTWEYQKSQFGITYSLALVPVAITFQFDSILSNQTNNIPLANTNQDTLLKVIEIDLYLDHAKIPNEKLKDACKKYYKNFLFLSEHRGNQLLTTVKSVSECLKDRLEDLAKRLNWKDKDKYFEFSIFLNILLCDTTYYQDIDKTCRHSFNELTDDNIADMVKIILTNDLTNGCSLLSRLITFFFKKDEKSEKRADFILDQALAFLEKGTADQLKQLLNKKDFYKNLSLSHLKTLLQSYEGNNDAIYKFFKSIKKDSQQPVETLYGLLLDNKTCDLKALIEIAEKEQPRFGFSFSGNTPMMHFFQSYLDSQFLKSSNKPEDKLKLITKLSETDHIGHYKLIDYELYLKSYALACQESDIDMIIKNLDPSTSTYNTREMTLVFIQTILGTNDTSRIKAVFDALWNAWNSKDPSIKTHGCAEKNFMEFQIIPSFKRILGHIKTKEALKVIWKCIPLFEPQAEKTMRDLLTTKPPLSKYDKQRYEYDPIPLTDDEITEAVKDK